ncbi:steroid delta-isomerase [Gammaproteobacteria bacterium 42_54_T18]|nr:steroid delta-isomerase [Gammaproteobacteria bacterium 42_54_T18]
MSQVDITKTCELGNVLVTGGAGFVGQNFVKTLLDRGYKVRSLDLVETPIKHKNLKVLKGDIRDAVLIRKAVKGIDTIFHTAAVIEMKGGPAATKKYRDFSYSINVEATKQLVILARALGVKRFVYTSSNSVVLAGKPLRGADETQPYTERRRDLYTETKVVAEQWVLEQNGVDSMLTCAIRPSSIWGPGDQTMFKKIFEQILAGRMHSKIGLGFEKLDNTFVHNLIQGQIKAAEHLVEGGSAPCQAYFINDDEPINAFVFSKPVFEAIGVKMPWLTVPGKIVMRSLEAWEFMHFKFNLPSPPLAPSEIERVSIDNYFSVNKARTELGYSPEYDSKLGMEMSMPYYKELFANMKLEKEAAEA